MAMKYLDMTGKTEEEAIGRALAQLGLDRDEVSVEILERAKSGFFGIGASPAKVRVTYGLEDPEVEETPAAPERKPEAPKPPEKAPEQPAEAAAGETRPEKSQRRRRKKSAEKPQRPAQELLRLALMVGARRIKIGKAPFKGKGHHALPLRLVNDAIGCLGQAHAPQAQRGHRFPKRPVHHDCKLPPLPPPVRRV